MTLAKASVSLAAGALALAACGGSLRGPETGPHPVEGSDPLFVADEPPPAVVETIPEAPRDERCVWVDGWWEHADRGWHWKDGGWVVPPEGCYFAAPAMGWLPGREQGVLWYRPGRWYRNERSERGRALGCVEPAPCAARTKQDD